MCESPAESGFYYVKSRYYDPRICRFINADDPSKLGANGDFASVNLFAYCGNNPVSRKDDGGLCWNIVIGATAGAAIGFIASITSQLIEDPNSWKSVEFWEHAAVSAGAGALTGAVAATGVGLIGQIAVNATVGAASGIIDTAIDADSNTKPVDYLGSAFIGAALGGATGYLGGPGTATKHMQSAFRTALHNGNWRYFLTQTSVEATRSGIKSISAIAKGTMPTISRAIVQRLESMILYD